MPRFLHLKQKDFILTLLISVLVGIIFFCCDWKVKISDQIYCDYCGVELKNCPFFYKLGRFVGKDLVCPVCFDEYFKGSLGKDKARKYDSETIKKIEG